VVQTSVTADLAPQFSETFLMPQPTTDSESIMFSDRH